MENDDVRQIIAMNDNEASVCLPRKIFTGELERYLTLGVFKRTNNFLYEINCPGGCGEMATVTKTISGKYITTCGHTDRPMEDYEIPAEEVELYRLDRVTFEKLCNDGTIDFDPALARAHAQRSNNIYNNNSPSLRGTGIDSNIDSKSNTDSNNNTERKKEIPKKGGGLWQTGEGKEMVDEFLDSRAENETKAKDINLARQVWNNPAHKTFVDEQINHSLPPDKANEAAFKNFYTTCHRAKKRQNEQKSNAARALEQDREALIHKEMENYKIANYTESV